MSKFNENVCNLLSMMLNIDYVLNNFKTYDSILYKDMDEIIDLSKEEKIKKIIDYIMMDYNDLIESDRKYINNAAKNLLEYDEKIKQGLNELVLNKSLSDSIEHNIIYVLCHMQISIIKDFIKAKLDISYHKDRYLLLTKLFHQYTEELKLVNNQILSL